MRPLVVGPSPVITPSRTTVRARAAVLRQEIFDGSMVATGSASLNAGADIGTVLFSISCSGRACSCRRKRVVNDSKRASRVFYTLACWSRWVPLEFEADRIPLRRRCGAQAAISGHRRFRRRRGFFAAGAQIERKCYQFPLAENGFAFLRRPFT